MATTLRRLSLRPRTIQCGTRLARRWAWFTAVAIASLACIQLSFAQVTAEIHRTLTVTAAESVTLDVEVPSGNVQILYGRDGQVSIAGSAKASADRKLDDNFFPAVLTIQQNGNHLTIRHVPNPAYPEEGINVLYRIDVPYRTEVTSRLNRGKQNISGIMGPVKAATGNGDIKAAYISKGLQAQVDNGDLDLQVIGEHVEARTGNGNISCTRVAQGVSAEAGDGDITLLVVGPSIATVKKGTGRVEVRGARGSFVGSTDGGDLHVRAIPHDDWQLSSASGSVRLEFPPIAQLELDASTETGQFQVDRDDIARPDPDLHHFRQKVNGGGKRIEVHTGSGRIVIR
jgi:Putative adhesin